MSMDSTVMVVSLEKSPGKIWMFQEELHFSEGQQMNKLKMDNDSTVCRIKEVLALSRVGMRKQERREIEDCIWGSY